MNHEARGTSPSPFERLGNSVKSRPEALLLLAAGCALLMLGGDRREERGGIEPDEAGSDPRLRRHGTIEKTRDTAASCLDRPSDAVASCGSDLPRTASEYAGRASRAAGACVEGLQTYGAQVSERLAETSSHLRDRARDSIDASVDTLSDQPLLLAAFGMAAGIAAAVIIPRSRIEEETLESMRERVENFGDDTDERRAHAAERATGTLAREARQRGLTPEGLKGTAGNGAGSVAGDASEASRQRGGSDFPTGCEAGEANKNPAKS